MFGVVIPWRSKLDELRSVVVREHSFQTFVELLGKSGKILRGIELGLFQFFWFWLSGKYNGRLVIYEPT